MLKLCAAVLVLLVAASQPLHTQNLYPGSDAANALNNEPQRLAFRNGFLERMATLRLPLYTVTDKDTGQSKGITVILSGEGKGSVTAYRNSFGIAVLHDPHEAVPSSSTRFTLVEIPPGSRLMIGSVLFDADGRDRLSIALYEQGPLNPLTNQPFFRYVTDFEIQWDHTFSTGFTERADVEAVIGRVLFVPK